MTGKILAVALMVLLSAMASAQGTSKNESGGGAIAAIMMMLFALLPMLMIGGFGIVWLTLFVVILVFAFIALAFWLFMLIDCVKRNFEKENDKILWILIIALTSWIGALLYYILVKRMGAGAEKKTSEETKTEEQKEMPPESEPAPGPEKQAEQIAEQKPESPPMVEQPKKEKKPRKKMADPLQ